MGLDMWFTAYPKDVDWRNNDETAELEEEIKYFRKHADLNGLLQDIWFKQNPDKSLEDFNCVHMVIDKDIIDKIEHAANLSEDEREHYVGFFWGSSTEEDWKETRLELIPRLKEALREGKTIIYHPWW